MSTQRHKVWATARAVLLAPALWISLVSFETACGHNSPSTDPLDAAATTIPTTPADTRPATTPPPAVTPPDAQVVTPPVTPPVTPQADAQVIPPAAPDASPPKVVDAAPAKADAAPSSGGGKLPPTAAPAGTAAIPVLFIGNSYTYVNELPTVLAQIAKPKRTIEVDSEATGGQTLEGHYGGGSGPGPAAIKKRKWTYIILQEQSSRPMTGEAKFLEFGGKLDELSDASGAQTMLYETWSRKAAPADQIKLSTAYERLARATDAYLAPVGAAWERVRKEKPALELFAADGSHPSFAGTYLGACVFYGMILATSPEGAPALELTADVASYLQKVAWETVQTYRF